MTNTRTQREGWRESQTNRGTRGERDGRERGERESGREGGE